MMVIKVPPRRANVRGRGNGKVGFPMQAKSNTTLPANNVRALDTPYAGYLFRSALEARWAVFFDALQIDWEYEARGYRLPDGTSYLPDFIMPGLEWIVEVKPRSVAVDQAVLRKIAAVSAGLVKSGVGRLFISVAGPPQPHQRYYAYGRSGDRRFSFEEAFPTSRVTAAFSDAQRARFIYPTSSTSIGDALRSFLKGGRDGASA